MKLTRLALLSVLLTIVIGAAPVLGATSGPPSGNVGVNALIDTPQFPAVTCLFRWTPDDYIQKIKVRAPIVYAFDRTPGTDTQWVGWRYRIQSSPNGTDWSNVAGGTSAFAKALATDHYNAQWHSRVYDVPQPPVDAFRVVVVIRWYSPTASHVDGHSIRYPTYYLVAGPGVTHYLDTRCGDTLG